VLFEDTADNLASAAALGMTSTVVLSTARRPIRLPAAADARIHFVTTI
jgi:hypothetical protein